MEHIFISTLQRGLESWKLEWPGGLDSERYCKEFLRRRQADFQPLIMEERFGWRDPSLYYLLSDCDENSMKRKRRGTLAFPEKFAAIGFAVSKV